MCDEGGDEWAGDSLAMSDEPGRQRGGHHAGGFRFLQKRLLLPDLEGRLDALQKGKRNAVSLVDVGDVDVETGFGVVVG